MGLKVIGSGLGRTGTASLKQALEQLGFGPCHHMKEVLDHPESVPLWVEAFEGRPDWGAIFRGYRSAVDAPTCKFWRELSACYPEAKIVHTVRQPDEWFDSTQASVFAPDSFGLNPTPPYRRFFELNLRVYTEGGIHDRVFMTCGATTRRSLRTSRSTGFSSTRSPRAGNRFAPSWACRRQGHRSRLLTRARNSPFEMRLAMRREKPKETRNWRRLCRHFCLATLPRAVTFHSGVLRDTEATCGHLVTIDSKKLARLFVTFHWRQSPVACHAALTGVLFCSRRGRRGCHGIALHCAGSTQHHLSARGCRVSRNGDACRFAARCLHGAR